MFNLGCSYNTARNRLVRDLLYDKVVKHTSCLRCNKPMTRENFTIDHIRPWRNEENSKELFYDLDNIAFSHHSCNSGATRNKKYDSVRERRDEENKTRNKKYSDKPKSERQKLRRKNYLKYGC